jgi:hypothetical protein
LGAPQQLSARRKDRANWQMNLKIIPDCDGMRDCALFVADNLTDIEGTGWFGDALARNLTPT